MEVGKAVEVAAELNPAGSVAVHADRITSVSPSMTVVAKAHTSVDSPFTLSPEMVKAIPLMGDVRITTTEQFVVAKSADGSGRLKCAIAPASDVMPREAIQTTVSLNLDRPSLLAELATFANPTDLQRAINRGVSFFFCEEADAWVATANNGFVAAYARVAKANYADGCTITVPTAKAIAKLAPETIHLGEAAVEASKDEVSVIASVIAGSSPRLDAERAADYAVHRKLLSRAKSMPVIATFSNEQSKALHRVIEILEVSDADVVQLGGKSDGIKLSATLKQGGRSEFFVACDATEFSTTLHFSFLKRGAERLRSGGVIKTTPIEPCVAFAADGSTFDLAVVAKVAEKKHA